MVSVLVLVNVVLVRVVEVDGRAIQNGRLSPGLVADSNNSEIIGRHG